MAIGWEEMYDKAKYQLEGNGEVVDSPDVVKVAMLAYADGMQDACDVVMAWVKSDDVYVTDKEGNEIPEGRIEIRVGTIGDHIAKKLIDLTEKYLPKKESAKEG